MPRPGSQVHNGMGRLKGDQEAKARSNLDPSWAMYGQIWVLLLVSLWRGQGTSTGLSCHRRWPPCPTIRHGRCPVTISTDEEEAAKKGNEDGTQRRKETSRCGSGRNLTANGSGSGELLPNHGFPNVLSNPMLDKLPHDQVLCY